MLAPLRNSAASGMLLRSKGLKQATGADDVFIGIRATGRKGRLQAGVLGAVRVRIARAGVGVAARGAQVRLGATGGPPTIRVFLGFTHLHAAAADFGFGAVAVAAASGDVLQEGRRVRKKRQRGGEKANDCAKEVK